MVFNYPLDSSRSPIPLYRAYRGESASKQTRDIIKAFVDQTNQSSLRKILISQKRSENLKMGKSFCHRIKKSTRSAGEVAQISLVAAGGGPGVTAQPSLQPQHSQYKKAHTSTPATSAVSTGSQPTHHPRKPTPSTSAMDTNHDVQGVPQVEKIQPSAEKGFYVMGEKMGSVLLEARSFIYSDIPKFIDVLKQGLVKGGEALFDTDDLLVGGGSIEGPGEMKSMIAYVRLIHDILLQASDSPPPTLPIRRAMWMTPGGRLTLALKALENHLVQKMEGVEPEKTKGSEGKRLLDTALDQIATSHQESILQGSPPPPKTRRTASTHSNDFPESEVFNDLVMDPKEASALVGNQHSPTTEKVQEKTPAPETPASETSVSGSGGGETMESKVERDMQLLMKKASNFIDPLDVSTAHSVGPTRLL